MIGFILFCQVFGLLWVDF